MENSRVEERLIAKAQEAFVLALEMFNRPTLHYRCESTCFLLCNAWELMLKAYLIKRGGPESIYYSDKRDRTITLETCIERCFTNIHSPVRKNLEMLVDLRNTGTHFIVEEYEVYYAPFIKAGFENFDKYMSRYHGIEVSDSLPDNYVAVTIKKSLPDIYECRTRYEPEVFKRLFSLYSNIISASDELANSPYYATREIIEIRQTKNKSADITFTYTNNPDDADASAVLIKTIIDPADKYIYRMNGLIETINERLKKEKVAVHKNGQPCERVNKTDIQNFIAVYSMKQDKRYGYNMSLKKEQAWYAYSEQAAEQIYSVIVNDPEHSLDRIKEAAKQK